MAAADESPGVLAEPRGLQPRARGLGVGVGVQRQHGVADEVLDERQRASTGGVVGVGHPARPERARRRPRPRRSPRRGPSAASQPSSSTPASRLHRTLVGTSGTRGLAHRRTDPRPAPLAQRCPTPAPDATIGHGDPWMPAVTRRASRRRRWATLAVVVADRAGAPPGLRHRARPAAFQQHRAHRGRRTDRRRQRRSNVLVVGSDSREELTAPEERDLTTGGDFGDERTDTILVLSAPTAAGSGMLSFPRDLYVDALRRHAPAASTRPCSSAGSAAWCRHGRADLRHRHRPRGDGQLRRLRRRRRGGRRGGRLPREGDQGPDAGHRPARPAARCWTGPRPSGIVRVRKIDSDLERIKRQQQFLSALAEKVATPATLLVPSRAWHADRRHRRRADRRQGAGPVDLGTPRLGARGLAAGAAVRATVPPPRRPSTGRRYC